MIQLGAVIAVALVATFGFTAYQTLPAPSLADYPILWQHSWLAWTWEIGAGDAVASLVTTGALGLIAATGLVLASRVFRRISSAEVYFFSLFLVSLAFEQLRVVQLYVLKANLPALYGVFLTRAVIAARIVGSFSLFIASLYAVGIDYPRIGSLTIGLGLLSLLFVYFIPVHSVSVGATMVHRIAGQSSLELAILISGVMTIINYAIAGVRGHRERGFLVVATAVGLVVGAQICSFFPSIPWMAVGVALLVYGVLTFILVTRAHFLWY